MKLTKEMISSIENAEAKALATRMRDGIHVVPVSTARVLNDKIILVNYFMGQTLKNLQENNKVALTCWSGLEGYQFKAEVAHYTQGEIFDSMVEYVADILPDRVVRGILELTPYEIYDVSATAAHPGTRIA